MAFLDIAQPMNTIRSTAECSLTVALTSAKQGFVEMGTVDGLGEMMGRDNMGDKYGEEEEMVKGVKVVTVESWSSKMDFLMMCEMPKSSSEKLRITDNHVEIEEQITERKNSVCR